MGGLSNIRAYLHAQAKLAFTPVVPPHDNSAVARQLLFVDLSVLLRRKQNRAQTARDFCTNAMFYINRLVNHSRNVGKTTVQAPPFDLVLHADGDNLPGPRRWLQLNRIAQKRAELAAKRRANPSARHMTDDDHAVPLSQDTGAIEWDAQLSDHWEQLLENHHERTQICDMIVQWVVDHIALPRECNVIVLPYFEHLAAGRPPRIFCGPGDSQTRTRIDADWLRYPIGEGDFIPIIHALHMRRLCPLNTENESTAPVAQAPRSSSSSSSRRDPLWDDDDNGEYLSDDDEEEANNMSSSSSSPPTTTTAPPERFRVLIAGSDSDLFLIGLLAAEELKRHRIDMYIVNVDPTDVVQAIPRDEQLPTGAIRPPSRGRANGKPHVVWPVCNVNLMHSIMRERYDEEGLWALGMVALLTSKGDYMSAQPIKYLGMERALLTSQSQFQKKRRFEDTFLPPKRRAAAVVDGDEPLSVNAADDDDDVVAPPSLFDEVPTLQESQLFEALANVVRQALRGGSSESSGRFRDPTLPKWFRESPEVREHGLHYQPHLRELFAMYNRFYAHEKQANQCSWENFQLHVKRATYSLYYYGRFGWRVDQPIPSPEGWGWAKGTYCKEYGGKDSGVFLREEDVWLPIEAN
jgi:hypothetical protein